MSTFNPYDKYASSSDIVLGNLVLDEWKCELVQPNHPALTKRASVDPFGSDIDWVEREKEMFQLMIDRIGIGLACPQIGQSYNMFVMAHSIMGNVGIYKPEILETTGDCVMEEGCLTWPVLFFTVNRPEAIKVRYYKNDGETQVETWMDGIDARCFLHEYDHLQGIVYLEHASDFKLEIAKKKRDKTLKKLQKMNRYV